jgi:hypothetical protein
MKNRQCKMVDNKTQFVIQIGYLRQSLEIYL